MKIKLLFSAFTGLCLLTFIQACRKEDRPPTVPPPPIPVDIVELENNRLGSAITPATINAWISGIVKAESGLPLPGVAISCGGITTTSDKFGMFRFPAPLTLNKDYAVLNAVAQGYFKGTKTFTPNTSGRASHLIEISLLKELDEKNVPASGGKFSLENGIALDFPQDAVVTSTGGSYSGNYKVLARYIDPEAPNFLQTMPGILAGLDDNNQVKALRSYGMVAVELKDLSGNILQLAPNKTVQLTLPANTAAPATIPLWHFNERYGMWIRAGTAIKSGNVYTAEVNHFSTWNLDVDFNSFKLDLQFNDNAGHPLAGLHVSAYTGSLIKLSSFYTDNEGKASLINCPASESIILKTAFECDTASNELGPVLANRSEAIILQGNASLLKTYTITGTLTDCDNTPLRNQAFQVSMQGSGLGGTLPGVTDDQGNYVATGTICNNSSGVVVQVGALLNNVYRYGKADTVFNNVITYNHRICDTISSGVADDFVVIFPDRVLDSLVRASINKLTGPLLYQDVKDIGVLYWSSSPVKDFTGIQFLTNLQVLAQNVDGNPGFDLIRSLKRIKTIDIGDWNTAELSNADISFVKDLPLLGYFSFSGSSLTDISPLANLTQLKVIYLTAKNLSDITPLTNLRFTESINLTAGISNLTGLRNMSRLKTLQIRDCVNLTDISGLSGAENLKTMYIYNSPLLTDISACENMRLLETLSIGRANISDISPLKNLRFVNTVQLYHNRIATIPSLKNMDSLQHIDLTKNEVSDISGMRELPAIYSIVVDSNRVSDLSAQYNYLLNLRVFYLRGQATGKIPDDQKAAFSATHPGCFILWD